MAPKIPDKLVKVILFSIVFLIFHVQSSVVINELNIIDPKKPETHEFIELKSVNGESVSLRSYKIVGCNCKSSSGTIELVVTLWNQRTNENGFFTIGGSQVSEANLKVPNDYIRFRNSFAPKSVPSLSNFIINGNKDVQAIGLLYDDQRLNPFDEIVLTKKNNYIRIDDKITELLKKYLIDLVIYGETKACDKCNLFEIIHEDFAQYKN